MTEDRFPARSDTFLPVTSVRVVLGPNGYEDSDERTKVTTHLQVHIKSPTDQPPSLLNPAVTLLLQRAFLNSPPGVQQVFPRMVEDFRKTRAPKEPGHSSAVSPAINGTFFRGLSMLTTLRVYGTLPPLHHTSSWHGQIVFTSTAE
jgi:hypothetical protein